MTSRIKAILQLIALVVLPVSNCLAIDVDRNQPIEIESDSAVIDDSQGLSTYRGNVVISQGSTQLTADSITVFAKDRTVSQIVANGAPATFNQIDANDDSSTTGQAEQITYQADAALLIFNGNAALSQATNSFSGERIEYDIMRKAIRAKGNQDEGTRVKIQYFPTQAAAIEDAKADASTTANSVGESDSVMRPSPSGDNSANTDIDANAATNGDSPIDPPQTTVE